MTTWRVALAEASRRLGDPMEARRIVEQVIGPPSPGLRTLLLLDDTMPASAVEDVAALVARRVAGEPLQHVLGGWGFRHLELAVDRRALVPRPETEVLVDHALAELDRVAAGRPGQVLNVADLGTGSGVIALSIAAERPLAQVVAVDRSPEAISLAEENRSRQDPSVAERVEIVKGDWFGGLPSQLMGQLALVVSNPPYLSADEWPDLDAVVRDYDPYDALVSGDSGLEAICRLVNEAAAWLLPGGALVVEIAPHQSSQVLLMIGSCQQEYSGATVERDLADRDRVLIARTPAASTEASRR